MNSKNILDSFLKTPQLYGTRVSPDLKWVAWAWANIGPHADIYITSLDKEGPTKKLTNFGQNTSIISWTEDSRFVVVEHDYDGDERYCLYKIDVNTGESTRLTEEHPSYFLRGGQIHPNNKYLVYGANYDVDTKKEVEPTVIYRHDLETGERVKLAHPQKPHYFSPHLNKQGTHIIYQRTDIHPKGVQIWMVDMEGKNDREILNFGDAIKVSASWHTNGEDVVFVSEAGAYRKVGVFNIKDSSIKCFVDDPGRNIEDAHVPRGSDKIVVEEIKNAQTIMTLLDSKTFTETLLSTLHSFFPLARFADGTWLSRYYNSKQPGDLVVHDASKIIRRVTNVFEKVDYHPDDLVPAENYTWTSIDDMKIQGWLYRPKTKPIGTIVVVHGGPTGHSEDVWDMDIQYFVSQGFAVLDPNYRGSTGFGLPFQEAIKESGWGGKEQDDIVEGVKSLIKDGIAEKGKVGITGTSYGGYSSWCAITRFPKEYIAAAIPVCGMTDLVVDYNTTRPDLRGYSEEMMGGTPDQVPDRFYNGSPIHFIQNIQGNLLIVQGAKDPNVSPENVRAVETALKEHRIKYEKLVFDDEGHGIRNPENQKVLLTKSVEFFKKSFENNSL